jgi:hypothetical protein
MKTLKIGDVSDSTVDLRFRESDGEERYIQFNNFILIGITNDPLEERKMMVVGNCYPFDLIKSFYALRSSIEDIINNNSRDVALHLLNLILLEELREQLED